MRKILYFLIIVNVLIFFLFTLSCKNIYYIENKQLVYTTDFSLESEYYVGEDEYGTFKYINEKYYITQKREGYIKYSYIPYGYGNYEGIFDTPYEISVDIKILINDYSKEGYGGIIFNWTDEDNFYYFEISSNGYFRLNKQVDDGWITIVSWEYNPNINKNDEKNRIKIKQYDNKLELYSNNVLLKTINESKPGSLIRLALASSTSWDENFIETTCEFDNVEIYKIYVMEVSN